jgi:hypothetical protein
MIDEPLNRRAFLAASAAAVSSSFAAGNAPVFATDLAFKLGVQSYTFRSFNLEQMLKRTKELGLKNAEFYSQHIPPDSSAEKIKDMAARRTQFGLPPSFARISSRIPRMPITAMPNSFSHSLIRGVRKSAYSSVRMCAHSGLTVSKSPGVLKCMERKVRPTGTSAKIAR